MNSKKIKALQELEKQLPPGELSFSEPVLEEHAKDKWFASHRPDAVALPRSTESVSRHPGICCET